MSRLYKAAGGKIPGAGPYEIYHADEQLAQEVLAKAIDYLARGLADLIQTFDPDIIVMGGGVSQLPDDVYEALRMQVKKYALPKLAEKIKIVRYGISESAGVIGAAMLAL